jgi:hypothetical protein
MILLGVIAGAAVVAASTLLKSEGPATESTEAPHTAPPSGVSAARLDAPVAVPVRGVTIELAVPAVHVLAESLCSASMHGERGLSGGGDA